MFVSDQVMMMSTGSAAKRFDSDLGSRTLVNLCRQFGGQIVDADGRVVFERPTPATVATRPVTSRATTTTKPTPAPMSAEQQRTWAIAKARAEHAQLVADGKAPCCEAVYVHGFLRELGLPTTSRAEERALNLNTMPPRQRRR